MTLFTKGLGHLSEPDPSTRSFYTHHVQRIVRNVVYYDALNIIEQIGCLKQQAYDAA
jgi:hypothetical protein